MSLCLCVCPSGVFVWRAERTESVSWLMCSHTLVRVMLTTFVLSLLPRQLHFAIAGQSNFLGVGNSIGGRTRSKGYSNGPGRRGETTRRKQREREPRARQKERERERVCSFSSFVEFYRSLVAPLSVRVQLPVCPCHVNCL